jgi:hypothetical protein
LSGKGLFLQTLVTAVDITPKAGKSAGAITIYYGDSTTIPQDPDDYAVTFDVAADAANNFAAATGLNAGTLVVRKGFATLAAIDTWLSDQSSNTATTLYKIGLVTDANTGWSFSDNPSLPPVVSDSDVESFFSALNKSDKFVDLKLSGMTSLPSRSFRACNSIVNLIIGDTVGGTLDRVFVNCTNLTNVTFPTNDTFVAIAGTAFGCGGLLRNKIVNITIPASGQRIIGTASSGPFLNCTALRRIEFLGDAMIKGIESTPNLSLIEGGTGNGIHNNAFYGVVTTGQLSDNVYTSVYIGNDGNPRGGLPGVYTRTADDKNFVKQP